MGREKVRLTARELVLKKYPDARLIQIHKTFFGVQVTHRCRHCRSIVTKTIGEGFTAEWAWHNASTFIQYAKSEKKNKK